MFPNRRLRCCSLRSSPAALSAALFGAAAADAEPADAKPDDAKNRSKEELQRKDSFERRFAPGEEERINASLAGIKNPSKQRALPLARLLVSQQRP